MAFLQKLAYKAVGAAAFGAGLWFAATQLGPKKPSLPPVEIEHADGLGAYIPLEQSRNVHDYLAPKYDKLVEVDEKVSGIDKLRVKLGATARGHVLEVAVGSGRNFALYGPQVSKITATDYSDQMLKQASLKSTTHDVSFVSSDAHKLSSTFEGQRFDTVVDTFGLCSFENPVHVLQEMQRVCKPDGQIILLEHGISTSRLMRKFMDLKANSHAHSWACIFNRDIEDIVKKSGLVVQHIEKKYFGTTVYVVGKPSPVFLPSEIQRNTHSL